MENTYQGNRFKMMLIGGSYGARLLSLYYYKQGIPTELKARINSYTSSVGASCL